MTFVVLRAAGYTLLFSASLALSARLFGGSDAAAGGVFSFGALVAELVAPTLVPARWWGRMDLGCRRVSLARAVYHRGCRPRAAGFLLVVAGLLASGGALLHMTMGHHGAAARGAAK